MAAAGQDAAQPGGTAQDGQGQGQDRTEQQEQYSVLGEDAFNDAPEELKEHLVNYVKTKVDPALTQRFQEASEFRSQWEPFSQIEGLSDLHPDDVDQLVELGYVLAAAGDENHPNRQQAVDSLFETWEQLGNQFDLWDRVESDENEEPGESGDGEQQYMTREEFEAELQEREARQQTEQQQAQGVQQTAEELRSLIGQLDLPGQEGDEEHKKATNAIYSFIGSFYSDGRYSNEDAVKAAFEDYQAIRGGAQSALIEETEERDVGESLRGGGANTEPEKVASWADADKLAKARLTGAGR